MDDIMELVKEVLAWFMEGSFESALDYEQGYEPYDVKNKKIASLQEEIKAL